MPMHDVIIIGAGISGMYLARELTKKGKNVVVLEKARGVGGRIANRRVANFAFNQGLRQFELKENKLLDLLKLADKCDVENNVATFNSNINSWMKNLAGGLDIRNEQKVLEIQCDQPEIEITTDKEIFKTKKLVITAPGPQASELLKSVGETAFLDQAKYGSSIFVMAVYAKEVDIAPLLDTLEIIKTENKDNLTGYLFKIKEDFMNKWLTIDREKLKGLIKEELLVKAQPPEDFHVHRWLYSQVDQSINKENQNQFSDKGIYLCGDYFGDDGVNSSIASAERILNQLGE
jgi:predicted NAD/FAD-dependent oxidoreductase